MCNAGLVQAVAAGSVIPLPGFLARMATITPGPPDAMGCTGLTITCPAGMGNLMLFNLGVPALVAPVLGGITAALTCNADGSWRTNNLPMAQIGMSITRVWCLTPLGVLPPGGMPGIPGLPAMPALPGAMIPAPG
ncbi:hypothetical protein RB195_003688 [Necator americanus]